MAWKRSSGNRVKMLYAGFPVGGYVSFLDYIPGPDQPTAAGVNVIVRVTTMHNNNAGTNCYIYVDGVYAAPVGFDTGADNEWRDGSVSLTLSPEPHSFTYGCNIGYVSGADGMIVSYW